MSPNQQVSQVPPQAVDAERATLGAMLQVEGGAEAIEKVVALGLTREHFYNTSHKDIFKGIMCLSEAGEGVDLVSLTDKLESQGTLAQVGGVPYLDGIIDSCPTTANVKYYATQVMEAATRRAYIKIAVRANDETVPIHQIQAEIDDAKRLLPRDIQRPESILVQDLKDDGGSPMIVGKGLLPEKGYTILGAFTKIGKSTFATQMCLSVISGTPFLGFPIEKQVKVLYCYYESDSTFIKKLVDQQRYNWGGAVSNFDWFYTLEARRLRLDKRTDLDSLKGEIAKTGAGLVVIDPVSRCTDRDINDLRTVTALVGALDDVGTEFGAAFLLVHHYGKPSKVTRQPVQALLGSSGFGNYCESFIGLERYSLRRSSDYKKLSFSLRHDRTPDDMCVCLNPATRLFEIVADVENIPAISLDRVVEVLKEHGQPVSYTLFYTLLQGKLGVSERKAKELITVAKEAEKISKENGKFGKYFIF